MTTAVSVLHVASGREWRGGQRQVLLLAKGLSAHEHISTSVVTGRGTELARRLDVSGVAAHLAPWSLSLDPRVLPALLRATDANTILHAHDAHAHTLADLVGRIRRAPVVVTKRSYHPIRHPARYRRAAAVIAVSEAVARQVRAAGVDSRRVHVVHDGIDLVAARTQQPWPADVNTPPAGTPLIVCVAALSREKGLLQIIGAATHLRGRYPELRWIVVGEGPLRSTLTAAMAHERIGDIVTLTGFITHPEAILARATIAVQPSLAEPFGSSILDAMALGVPVVASAVGGIPEALAHGGGILVPPGEWQPLAAAVERLLRNDGERAALGEDGRRAVESFSQQRMVNETLDVYRSLMQTPVAT